MVIYSYHAYDANIFISCFAILYYYGNLLSPFSGLVNLRFWVGFFFGGGRGGWGKIFFSEIGG